MRRFARFMTVALVFAAFQNCGQDTTSLITVGGHRGQSSGAQTSSGCATRVTDNFIDTDNTQDFTLGTFPSVPSSIFVMVNGLVSQDSTYDLETNIVHVNDYELLTSETPAMTPPQISITYCVMK